jgi:hypothetical protein
MNDAVAERLRDMVVRAAARLETIDERDAARPPASGKWSPKQVLGHLIDSASNNHQRFVRAQFTDDLVFPGYEQEKWVAAQKYDSEPWPAIVTLWREFNLHLAHVIEATPAAARMKPRRSHNLDAIAFVTVPREEPVTLDYFMNDYIDHLEHHLRQISTLTP